MDLYHVGPTLRRELIRCVWGMVHSKEHGSWGYKVGRKVFVLVGKEGVISGMETDVFGFCSQEKTLKAWAG